MARIEALGGEGIVLKLRSGLYRSGQRSRSQLKIKFRKTVDCVVTDRNRGKNSNALLGLYDGPLLRHVGRCSMIGKPDALTGDVVEVLSSPLFGSAHRSFSFSSILGCVPLCNRCFDTLSAVHGEKARGQAAGGVSPRSAHPRKQARSHPRRPPLSS